MNLPTRYKIGGARLMYRAISLTRKIRGKRDSGEFIRNGLRWHLNLQEGVDFAIYLLGGFENTLTKFYSERIATGEVVIDIGANIGAHTLHLAKLVGASGRVIAIEATEYAMRKLLKNLELNPPLSNTTTVIHALLLDSATGIPPREITSSWPLNGTATDSRLEGGTLKSVGQAEAITLDRVIAREKLTRVDWLKVDVDGNETSVLTGGTEMLRKFRPKILIEFSPYCHAPGSFDTLVRLLTDAGYAFFTIPGQTKLPNDSKSLEKLIDPRGSINVFASTKG